MIRRFFRCERGNFGAISAIASVPLMAGVIGAVDYYNVSSKAAEIQNALDAAALAAGTKILEGGEESDLPSFAEDYFRAHMGPDTKLAFDFTYKRPIESEALITLSSDNSEDYLSVLSRFSYRGMIANNSLLKGSRRTIAKVSIGRPACMLALNRTASEAIKIQGTTEVMMNGCILAANSKADDAVSRGGSAKLTAECVLASGGTDGIVSNSNADLECGAPLHNQYPASDPLKDVTPPSYTACQAVPGGKEKSLSPGTFCNKTLSGQITLDPGVYILRGGSIKLGGNGSLTGTGVTIFLMDGASISFGANEQIQLSPPEEPHPYAGITIYQPADNDSALTLNGGGSTQITGFVYAPGAHIQFAGNSNTTGSSDCIRLVGDTIELTGTSNISTDCEGELGDHEFSAGRHVSIVR